MVKLHCVLLVCLAWRQYSMNELVFWNRESQVAYDLGSQVLAFVQPCMTLFWAHVTRLGIFMKC